MKKDDTYSDRLAYFLRQLIQREKLRPTHLLMNTALPYPLTSGT